MNAWLALGNVFNQSAETLMHYNETVEAQKHDKIMAEKAMEFEREMWKTQTDYNAPVNQVARLREAGINPYATFGQIAGNNTMKNVPSYHKYPYHKKNLSLPDMISMVSSLQSLEAQKIANDKSRLEYRLQSDIYNTQVEHAELSNKIIMNDLKYKYKLTDYEVQRLQNVIDEYNNFTKPMKELQKGYMQTYGTDQLPVWVKFLDSNLGFIGNLLKDYFKNAFSGWTPNFSL